MKTSIVIACYNGEKYIEKQLYSLYKQTVSPDEVLIFDDQSVDNTRSKVIGFIQLYGLENNWHFFDNAQKLGCAKNFIYGALKASGDIIFFCDQDDIWDDYKIEYMINGFKMHNDMLACYCLKELIDEEDNILKSRFCFADNSPANGLIYKKIPFSENIKYNNSPGLCLAFKKNLINDIFDMIIQNNLMHDIPIGNVASLKNGYYLVNKKLVYHRIHSKNISTPRTTIISRIKDINSQIVGREQRLSQYIALDQFFGEQICPCDKNDFYKCIKYTQDSIYYLRKKKLLKSLLQIFNFNRMINRWISLNNFFCILYSLMK